MAAERTTTSASSPISAPQTTNGLSSRLRRTGVVTVSNATMAVNKTPTVIHRYTRRSSGRISRPSISVGIPTALWFIFPSLGTRSRSSSGSGPQVAPDQPRRAQPEQGGDQRHQQAHIGDLDYQEVDHPSEDQRPIAVLSGTRRDPAQDQPSDPGRQHQLGAIGPKQGQ